MVFFDSSNSTLHTNITYSAYNVNVTYNLTILTKLTTIKLFTICTSYITIIIQGVRYNRRLSHLLICNLD